MPFDGPAAVLMEAGDSVDQQTGDHGDPTVFFVNVREPLRRFDEVSGRVAEMRPVATEVAWSVCLSGGHNRESFIKTAKAIEVLFRVWTWMYLDGPEELCTRWEWESPGAEKYWGTRPAHCEVLRISQRCKKLFK